MYRIAPFFLLLSFISLPGMNPQLKKIKSSSRLEELFKKQTNTQYVQWNLDRQLLLDSLHTHYIVKGSQLTAVVNRQKYLFVIDNYDNVILEYIKGPNLICNHFKLYTILVGDKGAISELDLNNHIDYKITRCVFTKEEIKAIYCRFDHATKPKLDTHFLYASINCGKKYFTETNIETKGPYTLGY